MIIGTLRGTIMPNYTITRDPETGLMIVKRDGVKIGQTQTEAAAKIIRRNDRRNPRHICPDPAFHKSECDH